MIHALLALALALQAPAAAAGSGVTAAEIAASREAAQRIIARPESVNPLLYATVVGTLWDRGDRRQAAFWLYVFQIRTLPWAQADHDGSGFAALRSSLSAQMGETVNGWIAADPKEWREVVERAIAWEARTPLHDERLDGMTKDEWLASVARNRVDYAAQARSAFDGLNAAEIAASRRRNGMPNGPLTDGGAPLPEAWR